MNKNELWKLYCQREKQVEKARNIRAIKTVAFFSVVIFLLIYFIEKPTGLDIIGAFLVSIVFAGIYFLINAFIFGQLSDVSEQERQMLANLKKKLDEAE